MTLARVTYEQRNTRKTFDCRICSGNRDDRRHRSVRCKGYISPDGRYAFCSREEYAGNLQPNRNGDYRHFLAGPCFCGQTHGGAETAPPTRPPLQVVPKPRKLHAEILETLWDGAKKAARWDYYDGDGAFVYAVVRYNLPGDKRYHPWQPVGDRWAMDEQDITRILYRLPELRAARPSAPVFIAEGEKCVEALRALGIVATCSPGGARKWHTVPDAAEELRGRHVVILPDCDKDGQQHAAQVAADIVNAAASVRIVDLPGLAEHEDVADWLARGGTKDELYELVMTTSAYATQMPAAQNSTPASQDDVSEEAVYPRDALAIARKRIEHLEELVQSIRDCMANPDLSAPLKLAWIAARFHLGKEWRPNGTPVRTTLSTIETKNGTMIPGFAASYGTSPQSAGDHLRQLTKLGGLNYKVEKDWVMRKHATPDGRVVEVKEPVSIATLAYGSLSMKPRDLRPETPRNGWGGKRVKACPDCKSTDLERHVTFTCHTCGTRHEPEDLIDVIVSEEGEVVGATQDDTQMPAAQNSTPASQDDVSENVTTDEPLVPVTHSFTPDIRVRNLAPSPWIIENMPPIPPDLVPAPGVPLDNLCPLNDGHGHIWRTGIARDSYDCAVCGATKRRKGGAA